MVYVSSHSGRDTRTVMWYKGRNSIPGHLLFDASTRLTFESAQLSDAGEYNISYSIVVTGPQFITKYASITLRVYSKYYRKLRHIMT